MSDNELIQKIKELPREDLETLVLAIMKSVHIKTYYAVLKTTKHLDNVKLTDTQDLKELTQYLDAMKKRSDVLASLLESANIHLPEETGGIPEEIKGKDQDIYDSILLNKTKTKKP